MTTIINCAKALFFFLALSSFSQSIVSNGYVFSKQYENPFTSNREGWGMGDWTFAENDCEFRAENVTFSSAGMSILVSEKSTFKGRYPSKPYWGGEYFHNQQNLFGRYEVMIKPDTKKGMITSFFLLNIEWNQDYSQALEWSEIDIEFVGNNDTVQFNLHWIDDDGNKHQEPVLKPIGKNVKNDFHLWAIEWTPTYIKFFLDGEELHSYEDADLLREQARPQEIRMNCWVSSAVEWAGRFNKNVLPVTTSYKNLVYYKLENPNRVISEEFKTNVGYVLNPNKKEIRFTTSTPVSDVVFYSTNGQTLNAKKIAQNTYTIEGLSSGLLLLDLKVGDKAEKIKIPMF